MRYYGIKATDLSPASANERMHKSSSLMVRQELIDQKGSMNGHDASSGEDTGKRGSNRVPGEGAERLKNSETNLSDSPRDEHATWNHDTGTETCRQEGSLREVEVKSEEKGRVLKLSEAEIHELTSSPASLPRAAPTSDERITIVLNGDVDHISQGRGSPQPLGRFSKAQEYQTSVNNDAETPIRGGQTWDIGEQRSAATASATDTVYPTPSGRKNSQTVSTPSLIRKNSSVVSLLAQTPMSSSRRNSKSTPKPLHLDEQKLGASSRVSEEPLPSPMPQTIPLPPYSLPTYLQLELSSHGPSPLYIHHSRNSDFPYESSKVKIERLQNFLKVPFQLEGVLWFGFFACLDAWLSSFTILPMRFLKAAWILSKSVIRNVAAEVKFICFSLYSGPGRLWRRRRASSATSPVKPSILGIVPPVPKKPNSHTASPRSPKFSFPTESDNPPSDHTRSEPPRKRRKGTFRKHKRAKSTPSTLGPDNKADIVRGFLILCSCLILMQFDASRMYHGIRGQAAIKLYVIYNVLEVSDRLFSAIGQDILECLFSKEALERKPDGRSKVMRPFWLFILALAYNLLHSTALFYQVITLNVAVNSYSNALLTLLMSNQFVEIKSTVFKKFEKENLFQLTCADVVERFQLWLMLTIIALRNLIETGGLTLSSSDGISPPSPLSKTSSSIYPKSFTIFPTWAGLLFQPFILVLGSEMLVDSLKHCYITKFNNTKPAIYGRFLDVLAKDYYTNAFSDQNLTRRLGLPVIPLSCLFIRALVQTYHMFLATHFPPPIASTATSLSVDSSTATNPASTAALHHIDHIFRSALGRSTLGAASSPPLLSLSNPTSWLRYQSHWSADDFIALFTMLAFFLLLFLFLLIFKLLLGMALLSYARSRYRGMKKRENEGFLAEGRRVGGWGVVEVDEDKRRWIYRDDKEGGRRAREREERGKGVGGGGGGGDAGFGKVRRYSMVAKRIW